MTLSNLWRSFRWPTFRCYFVCVAYARSVSNSWVYCIIMTGFHGKRAALVARHPVTTRHSRLCLPRHRQPNSLVGCLPNNDGNLHYVSKKICRLFCFCNNLVECQPIRVIFGTVAAEYISNSRTYVLPTAPNVCSYTTLPKKISNFYFFCAQFMVAARLQNLVRFQDDSSSWVVKSRRECLLSMAVVVVAGMQLQL